MGPEENAYSRRLNQGSFVAASTSPPSSSAGGNNEAGLVRVCYTPVAVANGPG